MMDCLASMYIDNELTLEEKVRFIDRIQINPPFYEDTRSLLLQERLLRAAPDTPMIPHRTPIAVTFGDRFKKLLRPMVYLTAGFALAMLLIFSRAAEPVAQPIINRFVIYEPNASQVELIGSFTDWQKTPMMPIGATGYWELRLNLPSGQHRFAYILDGNRQITDPTMPVREKDDFGGENSILNVEAQV
jgi:hypothetical protein